MRLSWECYSVWIGGIHAHTHFIISVCLSLFSLLAQANIFVFILQGNCFSSADLACGREKEKESSENGNWLYCFCIKSSPWQSLRQVVRETGGNGGKEGMGERNGMRERGSEGGTGQRDKNRGITEGGEDSSGCWGMKKTQRSIKMERRRQRERKKVWWWAALFMFSEVEYLI